MIKREDIQYRIGQTFKNADFTIKGASFLIYIDARCVYDELDLKYKDTWSFDWSLIEGENAVKGKLFTKERRFSDVGYPNDSKMDNGKTKGDWLKDAVSDAVKRCGVQAGVGRELYSAPFLYAKDIELNLSADKKKVSSYEPLNNIGKQIIEGNIDKWYKNLQNENNTRDKTKGS